MDLQESNVQRQRRRISRLVRENAFLGAEVGRHVVTIDILTADIERMTAKNRELASRCDDLKGVKRENELLTEEIQKLNLQLSEKLAESA